MLQVGKGWSGLNQGKVKTGTNGSEAPHSEGRATEVTHFCALLCAKKTDGLHSSGSGSGFGSGCANTSSEMRNLAS